MTADKIVVLIMACFAIAGAADRICGNRLGIGKKFEEGFMVMGSLALSMVGMLVLAPAIAKGLSPIMTPIFEGIGSDPSVFAGIFLGTDMGGAPLAREMAGSADAADLSGMLVGGMLGVTIVFTIPVALQIAGKEGEWLAGGMIAGLITIPLGCLIGGAAAGFAMNLIAHTLVPVAVISVLLALGIWKFRDQLVQGFIAFGKFILCLSTAGIALGIMKSLMGLEPIHGLAPIEDAFAVVANCAVFLSGAFPLMYVLNKLLSRPLKALGSLMGINQTAAAGLLVTLVNVIPMAESMKDMDDRGKVINSAFCVSAAFTLGDYFAYAAAYNLPMLIPAIIGKLAGGISAVILALILYRNVPRAAEKADTKTAVADQKSADDSGAKTAAETTAAGH